MAGASLRIVNESSYRTAALRRAIDAMERALRVQLRSVARAWGEYVWQVVDDANKQGFEIVLLDDAAEASTLGYHDLRSDGRSYARVFVRTILEHGGKWVRGANSVSATVSHEACEMVGDPTANHWVETGSGAMVARELCDPVESCAYTIALRDGREVSVSNFLYPDWFNPFASGPGKRLDHMRVLAQPFKSAPGGYVLHRTSTGVRTLWGPDHPRWRRAAKAKPGARTYARRRMR